MEVQQIGDQVADKAQVFQDKEKNIFDKKGKPDDFQQGDLVLKWDARHEDKDRHGKLNICGKALMRLQRIMAIILTVYRKSMVMFS